MTASGLETYLDNSSEATRIGGSGRIFRITNYMEVTAEVEMHGFTLIFSNRYRLLTSGTGHIIAGRLVAGVIEDNLTIISEEDFGMSDQSYNNTHTVVRDNSKWTTYGLVVKAPDAARNHDNGIFTLFNEGTEDSLFEHLTIEVGLEGGDRKSTYFAIYMSANTKVTIYKLRGANLVYSSGDVSFIDGGQGWLRSQNNQKHLKLMGTNKTFTGLAPRFVDSGSYMQTTSTSFGATEMTFKDSFVEADRLLGFPANNNKVIRYIKRTFKFQPVDGLLNPIDGFSVRITANRVVGSNPFNSGDVDGVIEKYKAESVSNGTEEIITVYSARRATQSISGIPSYQLLTSTTSDKEIEILFRHPQYVDNIVRTNTYLGAFNTTKNILAEDKAYDTTIPANSITGISIAVGSITISEDRNLQEVYNYCKEWSCLSGHMSYDMPVTFNNSILDFGSYNVTITSNSTLSSTDNIKIIQTTGTLTVDSGSSITASYVQSDGKVPVFGNIQSESGVTNGVWGVWLHSQGVDDRTGIQTADNGEAIALLPNTDYYIIGDAINSRRTKAGKFNTGDYGREMIIPLGRIKKPDNTNLLPDTLTTDEQRIADMFTFDVATKSVTITLPSDYATDTQRWDDTHKIFTFISNDLIPIQYKADEIQSQQVNLADPYIVDLREGEIVIDAGSSLKFIQDANNVDCTINMTGFTIRRETDTQMLNTFIDNSNGTINVNAGTPTIANVSVPPSALSTFATKSDIIKVNNNVKKASKLIPASEDI